MNNIQDLHKAILVKREEASEELESVDPRLRSGAEGRIRQAKIDVVTLENKYRNEIVRNTIVIAVDGPGAKKFGELASDKFKTVSINYFKILNDITESVSRRGGRNIYSTNEHLMVLDELNKAKLTYGIISLPVMQTRFEVVGIDMPLKESLYKNFAHQYGPTLYTAIIKAEASRQALENGFSGSKLPIVVYDYDQEIGMDNMVLPGPAAVVSVTEEEVNEAFVKKTLTKIRDSLKPQKQPKEPNQDQQTNQ